MGHARRTLLQYVVLVMSAGDTAPMLFSKMGRQATSTGTVPSPDFFCVSFFGASRERVEVES
jgi:hypothetical protein